MKKFVIAIIFLFMGVFPVYSEHSVSTQKGCDIRNCVKTFPIGYEKLYYLTLAGLNDKSYQIKEMQTKGGYILFEVNDCETYLATIIYVSSSKSILKITPTNGKYDFPEDLPKNIFQYIEKYMLNTF